MESREIAIQAIKDEHYESRHLDPKRRHEYALLLQRINQAEPVVAAYEKACRERDAMARWYDKVRLGSDELSLGALESEYGHASEWSLGTVERIGEKITRQRRNRGDGVPRGYVAPPPGGVPGSGNWRG